MQVSFQHRTRAPDEIDGIKVSYLKRARSTGHKIGWYLILLAVLSPVLYLTAGVVGTWLTMRATGVIMLSQREIRAPESGIVSYLDVRPGQTVNLHEVLVRIDNFGLDAQAMRNGLERQTSMSVRQRLVLLHQAQLAVLRARQRTLRYQVRRRAGIASLVRQGAATAAELATATAAVSSAEAAVAHAQETLADDMPHAEVTTVNRNLIERRLGALTRRSPFAGRVLKVLVKRGEFVFAAEPLLVVARLDHPRIVAYVPPRYAPRLVVGTVATVRFPNGTRMRAIVTATPRISVRLPSSMADQLGSRPLRVLLDLLPSSHWPRGELIANLPVSVRFHYRWESSAPGRVIGRILGSL